MQVVTCIDKPDPNLARRASPYRDLTRRRILEAAEKVFSRDGFQGATTREIAREAQVNEVTLFRHFRTRDDLLRETILYRTIAPEELLNSKAAWKTHLPTHLQHYVPNYYPFPLLR